MVCDNVDALILNPIGKKMVHTGFPAGEGEAFENMCSHLGATFTSAVSGKTDILIVYSYYKGTATVKYKKAVELRDSRKNPNLIIISDDDYWISVQRWLDRQNTTSEEHINDDTVSGVKCEASKQISPLVILKEECVFPSNTIVVGDPGYGLNFPKGQVITNVKPGSYKIAFITNKNGRITEVDLFHASLSEKKLSALSPNIKLGSFAVDSGYAGLFDYNYYCQEMGECYDSSDLSIIHQMLDLIKSSSDKRPKCLQNSGTVMGFFSETGYGDGWYDAVTNSIEDNQVEWICIRYIEMDTNTDSDELY